MANKKKPVGFIWENKDGIGFVVGHVPERVKPILALKNGNKMELLGNFVNDENVKKFYDRLVELGFGAEEKKI